MIALSASWNVEGCSPLVSLAVLFRQTRIVAGDALRPRFSNAEGPEIAGGKSRYALAPARVRDRFVTGDFAICGRAKAFSYLPIFQPGLYVGRPGAAG